MGKQTPHHSIKHPSEHTRHRSAESKDGDHRKEKQALAMEAQHEEKVKEQKEAIAQDKQAQKDAIAEAGLRRAIVDTAKQIASVESKAHHNYEEMKERYHKEQPGAISSAVAVEKRADKLSRVTKALDDAATNLAGETKRYKEMQRDGNDAAKILHEMSKDTGHKLARLKKTLTLSQRLQRVVGSVDQKLAVHSRLGEDAEALSPAYSAGLKLLKHGANVEVRDIKKEIEQEELLKTQFEQSALKLQHVREHDRKSEAQAAAYIKASKPSAREAPVEILLGESESISAKSEHGAHAPAEKPTLKQERATLVKEQLKLTQVKKDAQAMLQTEAQKLDADERVAVAEADLKVKQKRTQERSMMDQDIDKTTSVDRNIASEIKDFRGALKSLGHIRQELIDEQKLEKESLVEAKADTGSITKFLKFALKDEQNKDEPERVSKRGQEVVEMKQETFLQSSFAQAHKPNAHAKDTSQH